MPNLPEIDTQFLLDFLTRLLNTPSPTGLAEPAITLTEETLKSFKGLKFTRNRKGALLVTWNGERDDTPRALTAHADTLGETYQFIYNTGLAQAGLKPHPDKFDMEIYDEDFELGSDKSRFYIYVAVE